MSLSSGGSSAQVLTTSRKSRNSGRLRPGRNVKAFIPSLKKKVGEAFQPGFLAVHRASTRLQVKALSPIPISSFAPPLEERGQPGKEFLAEPGHVLVMGRVEPHRRDGVGEQGEHILDLIRRFPVGRAEPRGTAPLLLFGPSRRWFRVLPE